MTNNQIIFINDQLRYAGFSMYAPEKLAAYTNTSFELSQSKKILDDEIDAILFFEKTEKPDLYYFRHHTLTMGARTHRFEMRRGRGITLKEGYNLLSGRAVYKRRTDDGNTAHYEWLQFDLEKKVGDRFHVYMYGDEHSFDLKLALNQIPLSNSNWERSMIMRSLQRGNLQAVSLKNGKAFLQADPANKDIIVHGLTNQNTETPFAEKNTIRKRKRIALK